MSGSVKSNPGGRFGVAMGRLLATLRRLLRDASPGPAQRRRLPRSARRGTRGLQAIAGTEIDCLGDDGPFDLAQRVYRGEEPSNIELQFALAVIAGAALGGIEVVGRGIDGHVVGAVDDRDKRVDVAPSLRGGRGEGVRQWFGSDGVLVSLAV